MRSRIAACPRTWAARWPASPWATVAAARREERAGLIPADVALELLHVPLQVGQLVANSLAAAQPGLLHQLLHARVRAHLGSGRASPEPGRPSPPAAVQGCTVCLGFTKLDSFKFATRPSKTCPLDQFSLMITNIVSDFAGHQYFCMILGVEDRGPVPYFCMILQFTDRGHAF